MALESIDAIAELYFLGLIYLIFRITFNLFDNGDKIIDFFWFLIFNLKEGQLHYA